MGGAASYALDVPMRGGTRSLAARAGSTAGSSAASGSRGSITSSPSTSKWNSSSTAAPNASASWYEAFITVVPDWLCEVLSPGTRRTDRMKKMPIYAREMVAHVWLADPGERTVEGSHGCVMRSGMKPRRRLAFGPRNFYGSRRQPARR